MRQLNGEVCVLASLGRDLQSDEIRFVLLVALDLAFRDPMRGDVPDQFPVGALIPVCDAADTKGGFADDGSHGEIS